MSDPMLAIQLHQAERAVELHPGCTLPELADRTGANRELLRDALAQLQIQARVHAGVLTRCTLTGQIRVVWMPGRDPCAGTQFALSHPAASAA